MNDLKSIENSSLPVSNESISELQTMMQMAEFLSKSTIVPVAYQNRPENTLIALDMANRMGVPVMMVMQNLYVVQGKPSWSGTAVASMIRNSNEFENVELVYVGKEGTDSFGAYVTAKSKKNGKVLKGATVTISTAKAEGWYQKNGSKWQTCPELMLCYRAHSWFGRQYAPELMMGLQSSEEIEDVGNAESKTEVVNPYEKKGDVK